MLDKFEPTLDADVHEHAAAALTDIVNISNNKPSLLMEELESEETLNHLFKYILDEVIQQYLFGDRSDLPSTLLGQYFSLITHSLLTPYLLAESHNLAGPRFDSCCRALATQCQARARDHFQFGLAQPRLARQFVALAALLVAAH